MASQPPDGAPSAHGATAASGRRPPAGRRPARTEWTEILALVVQRLAEVDGVEEATRLVVDVLAEALPLECCTLLAPGGDGTMLAVVHRAGRHQPPLAARGWPADVGLFGEAFQTRAPVVDNDITPGRDHPLRSSRTRSQLVVPMCDSEQVLGLLDLQARRRGYFTADAPEVVQSIAAQALVVRQLAEAREGHERRHAQQRAVHRAGLSVLFAAPCEDTLRDIAVEARRLCGCSGAAVYTTEADADSLRLAAGVGIPSEMIGSVVDTGRGIAGLVAQRGGPVAVADYQLWEQHDPAWHGFEVHSCAAVPLRGGDGMVGVLMVLTTDPGRALGDDELAALELLAAPAALAITNARHAVEHRMDLESIAAMTRSLAHETDAARVRRAVCSFAVAITGARLCLLWEPGAREGLTVTAAAGVDAPDLSLPLDASTSATIAFRSGQPVHRPSPAGESAVAGVSDVASELSQPLLRDGTPVAVLTLAWEDMPEELSTRMRSLVAVLTNDAALAVERADAIAQLDQLSNRDTLTGMPNRNSFDETLLAEVQRVRNAGTELTVALLEVDDFGDLNDGHGQETADLLLREVVEAWRRHLRGADVLARYGDGQFAVTLPGCGLKEAVSLLERLRQATPGGHTTSAGVAAWDGDESSASLVARADAALYEATLSGHDRTVVAVPDAESADVGDGATPATWTRWTEVIPRLLVERSLRSAYQPVVHLATGDIVAWEALARPLGVAADASVEGLFTAAQYAGLSSDLEWLCRRAAVCGPLPRQCELFVNVAVSTLIDPLHDVDQMLLLLRWAGRSAEQVVLEITEREAVADLGRFVDVLSVYREHGFRFAIDDVGEGHSTLEVLAAACPEYVKIARSLVVAADRRGARSAISAVVAFARSGGAAVIAEGIENERDRRRMAALGVELGQGWVLGRPLLLVDAPEMIASAAS